MYNVHSALVTFIKVSMTKWKTELDANRKKLVSVKIKRGIYQGDSLSPLLFCICLNMLSNMLEETQYGYQFKSGTKISHLFYIDDIKLYANKERDIDSLIHLTQVLRSQLNAKNHVMAINTYALPVIRYPASIIKWTEEAIKGADIATRKLLTMHGALHPKSDTTKLYIDRKDGGKGLLSVQQRVKEEEQHIRAYAAFMATSDKLLVEFQSAALTMNLRPDDEEIDWHTKPFHGGYHRQISKKSVGRVWPVQPTLLASSSGLYKPLHWWESPGKVNKNDLAKILWNFYIRTDKHVLANQPDRVVVDKENKRATIIEIAVPNYYNISSKKKEKVEKYLSLGEEIEKCWNVRTTVIPVVIGALGAITPAHKMWLAEIPTSIKLR
ncbi:uncharacterized protein [Watersipora subatra]|uniref:uncharacterized protein n=1 Tax=Watersipora subatra TaxID=2589382 RepID=UPI00355C2F20